MRIRRLPRQAFIGLALSFVCAAPLAAQGNGHPGPPPGRGNGSSNKGGSGSGSSTSATVQQSFGTWIDNAEILAPGESWISLYGVYWQSETLREIDAPAVSAVVGLAPRVQLGASVPYYYLSERTGKSSTSNGWGASYISGKVSLVHEPRFSWSVSPTLEILSWGPDVGLRRLNGAVMTSVQTGSTEARVYATAGYFSRGSVFGSGAVEVPVTPRVTLTANVAHSYSTTTDLAADAAGLSRHRTDATGGFYAIVAPGFVIFASAGRTFSPNDANSTRAIVTGGIAIGLSRQNTLPPRAP